MITNYLNWTDYETGTAFGFAVRTHVNFGVHLRYHFGTSGLCAAVVHNRNAASGDVILSDIQKAGTTTKVSYKAGYNIPEQSSGTC